MVAANKTVCTTTIAVVAPDVSNESSHSSWIRATREASADLRLCPTSQSPGAHGLLTVTVSFFRCKHGKGTIFLLRSGDGRDPQQALFLYRCQSQQPQRSSCETSDVIVVADVIHDLAPASRTAFSALQRAVNVRKLRVKTLQVDREDFVYAADDDI